MPEPENPTQLKSAVTFGVMYALVLFALAATQFYLGADRPLLRRCAVGADRYGCHHAFDLTHGRQRSADHGRRVWRLIIVGAMANLVFKSLLAGSLGGWQFMKKIAMLFAIPFAGGILILLLWPGVSPSAVEIISVGALNCG